ncbi:MAG: DUF4011 domain-containing protein, partial [Deltaproteobacteria bacterium]|nr:DUF4011 domain-containing protein [Deltaproteobacteria bacterium]
MDINLSKILEKKLENLQKKVLDLSGRNPLVSTNFSSRSTSLVRVINCSLGALAQNLSEQKPLALTPLPQLAWDLPDENGKAFLTALEKFRRQDEDYLSFFANRGPNSTEGAKPFSKIKNRERALKDKVRLALNMPVRLQKTTLSLEEHALAHDINPSYDLLDEEPKKSSASISDLIQTLLLPDELDKRLTTLATKCRTWEEETGVNALAAALGFLTYDDPKNPDRRIFSPLILIPLKLERKKTAKGPVFLITAQDDPFSNYVLTEKLKSDLGTLMLDYQPNQNLESYFKDLEHNLPKKLKGEVKRQAVVGLFPSSELAVYNDLNPEKPLYRDNSLVNQVLLGQTQAEDSPTSLAAPIYDLDNSEVEYQLSNYLLNADSSQLSCVYDVILGKTLAVEGPPGTGKSQTIVNIIAQALARGLKVIFVAEKTAALEVVKSRLEAAGLGHFLLPLQANRSERGQVIDSLRQRLNLSEPPAPPDLRNKIQERSRARESLNQYVKIVSENFGLIGLSLEELTGRALLTASSLKQAPAAFLNLNFPFLDNLDSLSFETMIKAGRTLEKAFKEAFEAKSYWRGLRNPILDSLAASNITQMAKELAQELDKAREIRQKLASFELQTATIDDFNKIYSFIQNLINLQNEFDIKILFNIIKNNYFAELNIFLENCDQCRFNSSKISEFLKNQEDPQTPVLLEQTASLAAESRLETLDLNPLASEIAALKLKLTSWQTLKLSLAPLTESEALLKTIALGSIGALKALTERLSPKAMAMRSFLLTLNQDSLINLGPLSRKGMELIERRKKLQDIFFKVEKPSVESASSNTEEEILALADTLAQSSWLGRLTLKFRNAKKQWLAMTKSGLFDRQEAAAELKTLVNWRNDWRDFENKVKQTQCFGASFIGFDTQFELFESLATFRDELEAFFPGTERADVRQTALSSPASLLAALPTPSKDAENLTFLTLGSSIENEEIRLSKLEENYDKLKKLIPQLFVDQRFRVETLKALLERLRTNLTLKEQLNSNIAARSVLEEKFKGFETQREDVESELGVSSIIEQAGPWGYLLMTLIDKQTLKQCLNTLSEFFEVADKIRSLTASLNDKTGLNFTPSFEGDLAGAAEFFSEASLDLNGLSCHSALSRAIKTAEDLGLEFASKAASQENVPLENLGDIIEASLYRAMMARLYEQKGATLSTYLGPLLDDLRLSFATLDKEIMLGRRDSLRRQLYRQANP